VDPKHVAIRKRLLEARVEFPEPFREAGLPVPAARHSPKIIRRAAEKKDRKKDVIPKPHPCFTEPKLRIEKCSTTPVVKMAEREQGNSSAVIRRQSGFLRPLRLPVTV
jgi:hypothetical protein